MELTKFITIVLKQESKIFKDNNFLYIVDYDDYYKITLNENLDNMSIKLNSNYNELVFNDEEKKEILFVLYFLSKSHLKLLGSNNLYNTIKKEYVLKNYGRIHINNYINIIENTNQHRTKKEIKPYNKKALLYLLKTSFKIDFSRFNTKEQIIKIKQQAIDLENKNRIKTIVSNILKSKQLILEKNILSIYTHNNIIKYDFDNLNEILENEILYNLNLEEKNYILKAILLKDKKLRKLIKYNSNDINNLLNLTRLDESFGFYDDLTFSCKSNVLIKKEKQISKRKAKKSNIFEKPKKEKTNIIGTNDKNARVKKEDIFISNGFGTIGELLGKQNVELKNEFDETSTEKAYFKPKLLNKKEKVISNEIESLVLWDLENIHYFDDFSTISRYVKNDNQFKIMAFSEKYRNYETINTLNFILNKLKKRNWIIKETKKIADDTLIEQFHKYKHSIKELIVISNDSDFRYIVQEANDLNIKTIVLHRHGRTKNSFWYDIASENISLKDIQ